MHHDPYASTPPPPGPPPGQALDPGQQQQQPGMPSQPLVLSPTESDLSVTSTTAHPGTNHGALHGDGKPDAGVGSFGAAEAQPGSLSSLSVSQNGTQSSTQHSTQHTTRSSSKFSIPSLDLASINSSSKTRHSENGADDSRSRYTFSRSGSFVLDGLESLHLKVKQVGIK